MAITGEELAEKLKAAGATVSTGRARGGAGSGGIRWVYNAAGANRGQRTTFDVHGVYEDAAALGHFQALGLPPPSELLPAVTFDRAELVNWLEDNGAEVGERPRPDDGSTEMVAARKGWAQRIVIPNDEKLSGVAAAILCMNLNIRYPEKLRAFDNRQYERGAVISALQKQLGANLKVEELPRGGGTRLTHETIGEPVATMTLPPDGHFVTSDVVTFCRELRTGTDMLPDLPQSERPARATPAIAERATNAIRAVFEKISAKGRKGLTTVVDDNNADRGEAPDGTRDVRGYDEMKKDIEREREETGDPNGDHR